MTPGALGGPQRAGQHPEPGRVRERREDRRARGPLARRAGRQRRGGRPARRLLGPAAGRLDQPVVVHPGGAGGHAGHAAEAAVQVGGGRLAGHSLPARLPLPAGRCLARRGPVQDLGDQVDPPARRVHLLAPQLVGGADGQAEAAVHAVGRQRAQLAGRVDGRRARRARRLRGPAHLPLVLQLAHSRPSRTQIPPANRPGAIRCPGSNWSFSARIRLSEGTGPHMSIRACTAAGARTTTALARAGGPSPPANPGSRSRARRSRSPARNAGDLLRRGGPGHRGVQHARGGRAGHRRVQPGRPPRGVHRVQHAGQGRGPEADLDQRAALPGGGPGPGGRGPRTPPGWRGVQGRGARPEHPAHQRGPLGQPAGVAFQQHRHPDQAIARRPVDLDGHRGEVGPGRRRDALGGRGRVGVARGHERGRGGQRVQPEDGLGDQAERPLRAGVQLAEVVPGHVLDDLAAGLGHGPVRADHGDADQQVAGGAVAQPARPGRARGEHAADRGRAGLATVAGAGRDIQGELLPGGGQHPGQLVHGHAGLRPDHQVTRGVLDHPVQPQGVDDQVELARRDAPGHGGPAAPRHHRELVLGRRRQQGAGLAGVGGGGDPGRGQAAHRVPRAARPYRAAGPGQRSGHRSSAQDCSAVLVKVAPHRLVKIAPQGLRRPPGARRGAGRGPHRTAAGWGRSCPGCTAPPGRTRSGAAAWCPGPPG